MYAPICKNGTPCIIFANGLSTPRVTGRGRDGATDQTTQMTAIMETTTLTLFRGYASLKPLEATLGEVMNLIRTDAELKGRTDRHRACAAQGDEKGAAAEKSACTCFAVAVRFAGGRRSEHICGHTGLGLADIDDIPADRLAEARRRITADARTLAAYTTISGSGLRVIYRVDYAAAPDTRPETLYAAAFHAANAHYAALTGLPCDLKCRNIGRLSGLAHDPDAYFNPEAGAFAPAPPKPPKPAKARSGAPCTAERAETEVTRILRKESLEYAHGSRNEYIMRTGYLFNELGVPLEEAVAHALNRFADYDGDVAAIFRSCYRDTARHATRRPLGRKPGGGGGGGGKAFTPVDEIRGFLASRGTFRHNLVTGKCEMLPAGEDAAGWVEVTDRIVNTLWAELSTTARNTRREDIRTLLHSAFVPEYNPFTHYLDNLPPWDGVTDHIALLAATVHVKGEAADFASDLRRWLMGMVASWMHNKVVNPLILTLIGPQGSYKSTWCARLMPPPLERYFHAKIDNNRITKDDMLTLSEFGLVCLEEIDEMTSAQHNQLKALVSTPHVNERAAYAHYKEHRPHIASFCATGNNTFFLNDLSGSRRWLVHEICRIDNPHAYPPFHDNLYAQTLALLRGGERYWMDADEVGALMQRNSVFEVPCVEKELIQVFYRHPMPGEEAAFMPASRIMGHINSFVKAPLCVSRVGRVLGELGYKLLRTNGRRGYCVMERSPAEVEESLKAFARFVADPDSPPPAEAPSEPMLPF